MFRTKKTRLGGRTLLIATVTAAVVALAGCAGSSEPQGGGSADSGTIDWWGYTPNKTTAEFLISEFNKEYPDIKVNFKFYPAPGEYGASLRPGLASNSGPDVINLGTSASAHVDQFGSFAVDLTPAFGEDGMAKVSELARDTFTLEDGSFVAAPIGFNSAGLLYVNKDIFDEYNLTPPTTLDEWVEVCETLEANGVQCFAIGAGTNAAFNTDTLHSIANSLHPGKWQEASTGEGSWDDLWFIETLEAWKNLQTTGIIPEGAIGLQQFPDANNIFMQQNAAMIQMGTWYNANLGLENMTKAIEAAGVADVKPFTLLSIPFPDMTNRGDRTGALFSDVDAAVAVNKKSDSIEAATTFALWLSTSEEGQQQVANRLELTPDSGLQPDFSQVELVNPEEQEPVMKAIAESAVENTAEGRFRFLPSRLIEVLTRTSASVLEGTMTSEQAAAEVQSVANAEQ